MKKLFLAMIIFILPFIIFLTFFSFYPAEGLKTGSYNFCTAFPFFPECTGWRTDPISDPFNYWFCDYVDLPKLCENKPDPAKQIMLRSPDFCCKFIGSLPLEEQPTDAQSGYVSNQALGRYSPDESIKPLIIWTDKDHYNFRDKVTVYGKFDFTNFNIKKNISKKEFDQTGNVVNGTSIQTGRIITEAPVLNVDIKLNGKEVLRSIPVHENGWFATFFHLNNRYLFANQNNLLQVEYVLYGNNVPLGGPKTYAEYHFTTGDIAKKETDFGIWVDDSLIPNKVRFGVNVENSEKFITLMRHDLVIVRLITPQGYVIPLEPNFSVKDLSVDYSEFADYGHGIYEIQVTYGDNSAKAQFRY